MRNKILIILILLTIQLKAQEAGSSGLSFLKMGFGARNIAMGDLGVASAYDITSVNYNPALITKINGNQIFISHNQWIQDVTSEMLGVNFGLFGLPFAFSINTTNITGFEIRTKPTIEPEAKFNIHYFYSSLSTGFNLIENLTFGTTFRFIYENILSDEASGYGFDFGLFYETNVDGLTAGLSLKNIGSMNELRNEATKLPTDLRFGIGYEFNLDQIKSDVTVTTGIQKYLDLNDNHFLLGAEIFYDEIFAIRLGYMSGYESRGITIGAGLFWNKLNFDYAFAPFSFNLGNVHSISLIYTF